MKFFIRTNDLILRLLTKISFLQTSLNTQYRMRSFVCVSTFVISFISVNLAFIIAYTIYQGVIENRARDMSRSISRQAFDTLYLLMQKGWTSKELDEVLSATAGIGGETEYQVKLYRNDGTATDNNVKKVLERGVIVNNSNGFRLLDIYPVEAKKVCLECHRKERQGNILAAVSVQQDIGPTIKGIKKKFIFYFFLLSPVPFILTIIIANFLNARIIIATELFHQKIQNVSSIGDLAKLETNNINVGFVEFDNMLHDINDFVKRIKNIAVDKNLLEHELHERILANKEMESFIYSISHDLRAPIRAMSGFAKIIKDDYAGKLDAQGVDYLDRILRGSEKSIRLIDALLHLSRITREEIELIEVNLSNKASKVLEELREMNRGRNVEVVVQEGLTASVDPRLIELALSNLLGNAWKFTSKTENARIEFRSIQRDGKTVYYVKDNGVGFEPMYAEKMFWPFHRLHSESEFEGTGVGLAIVERVIRRHGGNIWAEGEVGKGATIYFTLGP